MKSSIKIWLAIAGILLIVLGIICLCKPVATLFATSWMIGCITLFIGLARLIFAFRTQAFLPNSATRMLSGLLLVILGIIFLVRADVLTASLPIIFSMWIIFEGVMIAVQSFDYKKVGFPSWWLLLLLGIVGVVFGILGLRNLGLSALTLSAIIGIGLISYGVSYLLAVFGITKFENKIKAL
jgi:uncharacterized membrane protein HdeD (DUF308 family)